MKGITPVIAVVLLLMIMIAMVGFAYVWFTKLSGSMTTEIKEQADEGLRQKGMNIRIDNPKSGSIVIKNSGSQIIPAGQIHITGIVEDECDNPKLKPGESYECNQDCIADSEIVVSAPGNVDKEMCVGGVEGGEQPPPTCGDGTCDESETCSSCQQDCGNCQQQYCGDNACNAAETCSSCPQDCGQCPLIPCSSQNGACCLPGYSCSVTPIVSSDCQVCCIGGSCVCGSDIILNMSFSSSGSPVDDSSCHNNDGTLSGPMWTSSGRVGGAYNFDGINDYIEISHSASMAAGQKWAAETWFRLKSYSSSPSWIIGKYSSGSEMFTLGVSAADNSANEKKIFTNLNDGNWKTLYGPMVSLNTWYHAVAVSDPPNLKLYLNGVLVNSRNDIGTINVNTANLRIGSHSSATPRWFNGTIDEVRIYKKALTADEITSKYNQQCCDMPSFAGCEDDVTKMYISNLNTYDSSTYIDSAWTPVEPLGYNKMIIGTTLAEGNALAFKNTGDEFYKERALFFFRKMTPYILAMPNPYPGANFNVNVVPLTHYGFTAYLLNDYLTANEKTAARNNIINVANYWAQNCLVSTWDGQDFNGDSKGEEYAWTYAFLSMAYNFYDARSDWLAAAKDNAKSATTRPSDNYINRCGKSVASYYNDYSYENHNILNNIYYSLSVQSLIEEGNLYFTYSGRTSPAEGSHNSNSIWQYNMNYINHDTGDILAQNDWGDVDILYFCRLFLNRNTDVATLQKLATRGYVIEPFTIKTYHLFTTNELTNEKYIFSMNPWYMLHPDAFTSCYPS